MNGFGNFQQSMQPRAMVSGYNLNDLQARTGVFSLNYGIEPNIDAATPSVAFQVANLVQTEAQRGHPIRVRAFEFLSQNGFSNNEFQNLVGVIVMRIYIGLMNNEWRNGFKEGAQATINNVCKAYAGFLTTQDPQFMKALLSNDPRLNESISRDANLWNYTLALVNNQVAYEPFVVGNGLPVVPRSATQNTSFSSNTVAHVAGSAFVHGQQNDYQPRVTEESGNNRYQRIREALTAEREQQVQQPQQGGFGMRSAMAAAQSQQGQWRPINNNVAGGVQVGETVVSGSTNTNFQTDFSAQIEQAPEPVRKLATVTLAGQTVNVVRLLKDGAALWKPSLLQPNRPAYCARTHRLAYFETDKGQVLAFLFENPAEQKEINMNYDAHAIDPTMGRPLENKKAKEPVREEAKVLYKPAAEIKIEVIVKKEITMSDSKESSIKAALAYARRVDNRDKPVVCSSVVNTAIVLSSEQEANETLKLLQQISECDTLKQAGPLISKIKDPYLAKLINESINKDINDFIKDGLGIVGASVSETVDTYSNDLEVALAGIPEAGVLYSARFAERIPEILRANTRAASAETINAYADAVLADGDESEADEELKKRTIFVQRNVNVTCLPFTEDELALVIPENEAVLIDRDYIPVIAMVVDKLNTGDISLTAAMLPDNYVVTSDGKVYSVIRSGLNPKTSLIKND